MAGAGTDDDLHGQEIQSRLDKVARADGPRSLRGALGQAHEVELEGRLREERQKILQQLEAMMVDRERALEERERAVAMLESDEGGTGAIEGAARTVQLQSAVQELEHRIDELQGQLMNERKRLEIAERLLVDPNLANAQAAEIERLERMLQERAEVAAEPVEPSPEITQRLVQHELEVMELRARLETTVDRELLELREGQWQTRLGELEAALAEAAQDVAESDGHDAGEAAATAEPRPSCSASVRGSPSWRRARRAARTPERA